MGAKKWDSVACQMKQYYKRNVHFFSDYTEQKSKNRSQHFLTKISLTLLFYYNFGRQVFNKQNRFWIIYFFCQKYAFVKETEWFFYKKTKKKNIRICA